jgi:hypothetical protein
MIEIIHRLELISFRTIKKNKKPQGFWRGNSFFSILRLHRLSSLLRGVVRCSPTLFSFYTI